MQQVHARIRLLVLYLLVSLPILIYGAVRALEASNNSPIDWVDGRFSERRVYDHFSEQFGPGDAVVISWAECWWTDPRLDEAVRRLRTDTEFQDADGNSYFHAVACGRETLLALTGQKPVPQSGNGVTAADSSAARLSSESDVAEDDNGLFSAANLQLSEVQAVQRLQGLLIGRDGRLTTIVCTLNSAGLALRARLVPRICEVVAEVCGTQVEELKLAGPVIDGLTVDEASHRSLTKFALPSTIVILVICILSLKSITAALVVFLTACFCQGLILAVIYYSGERLSALLIILPPLVQVLAVSGGIHLMNYYLNALRTMEPRQAAVECFRLGWLPSLLSLGTTAMGTASLLVSGLLPIRLFGIYGTVGVLCTAAAVLTAVPCSMMLLGRKRAGSEHQSAEQEPGGPPADGVWHRLTALLCNYNAVSILILFGLMGLAAVGLPDLRTSVRIETLYEPNSRIMQDYAWLEDRIGALVPIEILLQFSADCQLNDRQRMDLVWKVDRVLKQQPTVKAVMSALTLFPDPPRMPGLSRSIQASLINRGIRAARPQFERAALLRTTAEGDTWRLTARVSALEPLDYGDVLKQLEQALVEPLEQAPVQARHQITLSTSGIMPLVHQIQGQLLSDLFNSLMSALIVITLTMTLVQAGILNGILAMASNVFPIVIAFGLMGLLAVPMDIGSVMTASIALGIAVDDTLHFLTFFRRELQHPGATRRSAVLATYLDCGPAMIQTSVSCGVGLLVFAFSDFVPTSRFAVLMAFLLALALAGDLLLLPALLLSPAGKLYESPRKNVTAE